MVTRIYESFSLAPPQLGPDGSVFVSFYETDDDGNPTGQKHVLPMGNAEAKQFSDLLRDLLGQRIETANVEQMRQEAAKHGKRG